MKIAAGYLVPYYAGFLAKKGINSAAAVPFAILHYRTMEPPGARILLALK